MPMRRLLFALFCSFLETCFGATDDLSISMTAADGTVTQIPAAISKPEGVGPFPAVVIMHDCSGVGPRSSGAPGRWAKELVKEGYVVLIPDSFTTRGHAGGVCSDPSPSRAEVNPYRRVRDAYAALDYLRTLPYVDGKRVGLMGGSHGGLTTLATLVAPENDAEPLVQEKRAGFVAGVALYPGCAARLGRWRANASGVYRAVAPVLILIGDKDDWTPAEPCRQLVEASQAAGEPVAIKVYAGAYHSFDNASPVRYVPTRVNANSPTGRGATTGGDPAAWADSIRTVSAFFDEHVRRAAGMSSGH